MNIVFHGRNAATFRTGFESFLQTSASISVVSDALTEPGEVACFKGAEVVIGTSLTSDHPLPENARLYQVAGAGYDGIDFSRIPPACSVCNCFGHEEAISEYVMAAILTRFIPLMQADSALRNGIWNLMAGNPGGLRQECSGSVLGILGYGHIGKAIAKRAKTFDMRVHVANRSPLTPDETVDCYYSLSELSNFFSAADILVIALPLTEATEGLVDRNCFSAMKPDVLLINVGRGQVVDEQALYEALKSKRIGGAVIDTWYVYPTDQRAHPYPGTYPFHELDNIIMTPHMSGWTHGTIRRRQEVMAENIRRMREGKPLRNSVLQANR